MMVLEIATDRLGEIPDDYMRLYRVEEEAGAEVDREDKEEHRRWSGGRRVRGPNLDCPRKEE